ncbi:MAG: hypothetical protein MZV63_32155 [Marinilabiliales bacterium]|nr:hypothetical protein [Marinilabiliales bacterium]
MTAESILHNWPETFILKESQFLLKKNLPKLIKELKADICVFSYSDVTYQKVMSISAIVNAAGANFMLLGPDKTPWLKVNQTGYRCWCCSAQVAAKARPHAGLLRSLMEKGLESCCCSGIPMPYGNLVEQKVQRFATVADLS